jgi:hypothetical protein
MLNISPVRTEYEELEVTSKELVKPVVAVVLCCTVNFDVCVATVAHLSKVYAPSVGVTLAPAFLWSMTIPPFINLFLKLNAPPENWFVLSGNVTPSLPEIIIVMLLTPYVVCAKL